VKSDREHYLSFVRHLQANGSAGDGISDQFTPATPSSSRSFARLTDASVDVEVDDSKASGEYANAVRLDPGADSRDSHGGDLPPTGSQGYAVVPDAD
jgi:hypothetical protein